MDREQRDRVGTFEDLKVWQEAHALTIKVFGETPKIPEDLQEALATMLERAAVEVPKSIAEGFRRRSPRDKAHFYDVAQSSLEALRYLFILCRDLNAGIDTDDLIYRGDQVARMIDGLVRSVHQPEGRGDGRGGRDRGGRGRHRRRGGDGGGGGGGREGGRGGQQGQGSDLPEDNLPPADGPGPGEDYADDE